MSTDTRPAPEVAEALRERVYSVLHAHSCDEEPQGHDWREHLPWDEPTDEADAAALADALLAALPAQREPASEEAVLGVIHRALEPVADQLDIRFGVEAGDLLRSAWRKASAEARRATPELDVERLAVAMNDAGVTPDELRLGRDLSVPAKRIAAAYAAEGEREEQGR